MSIQQQKVIAVIGATGQRGAEFYVPSSPRTICLVCGGPAIRNSGNHLFDSEHFAGATIFIEGNRLSKRHLSVHVEQKNAMRLW